VLADTQAVGIECNKDGVKFVADGDIGKGAITIRPSSSVDKPESNIEIDLVEPVALSFSLKYLVNFAKATNLSNQVKVCLSNEVPLLVEYTLSNNSYLRFYLAPKVCVDNRKSAMLIRALDWRGRIVELINTKTCWRKRLCGLMIVMV
jgi:proliferating cell nuclear antigen